MRARGERDGAGRLADGDARQLGIAGRGRELGGGRDLVERQRAGAQGVVERGQARAARSLVRVMRAAVRWSLLEICASHCALDEHPAACQSPSSSASRTISVTRCLRRARSSRDLAQLAPARLAAALQRVVDGPINE